MTSGEIRRWLWVPVLAAACGGSGSSHSPQACTVSTSSNIPAAAAPNVMPISVDGLGCVPSAYFNEPCVSATVCVPKTSTCQKIDGLLLDTGSTGLRVFSQVLPSSLLQALPAVTQGGNPVGECIAFLDGSSQWGPVVQADVVLGGEPAVTVPIQLIESTFANPPSACSGPLTQTDPVNAGYNGILGVQNWIQDCGPGCAHSGNGWYFGCSASACTGIAVSLTSQVTNPVAALPTDGNGVIVELPSVPLGGAASVAGSLVLGIGTRANNVPGSSVVAFPLDNNGYLRTAMSAGTDSSFLDTGSNGIFFSSTIAPCSKPDDAWFCPATPVAVAATNMGAAGVPSAPVCFQIESIDALGSSIGVSSAVGGPSMGSSDVDWGLPFHFGRNVFVGIEGKSSPLGTGPLVAY